MKMDDFIAMRALHVFAVVIWIGGVSMMTTVILPALRRGDLGDAVEAFDAIERRFVWQARSTVLLVGVSGFYMVWRLDLWDRFSAISFWWMHAMVGVWLLFAFILFIAEPFILHRRIHQFAKAHPDRALRQMQRSHWVLLALSTITILGAVAGSHGWSLF
jgi:uncharacterized membrane protein